jgi:zinc protease
VNLLKPLNWNSLPGPDDITRVELPNGITILTRSNFNSPSVVVSGYLASGSVFDPLDQLGMAYFTAASLMRGTQNYSFQAIYDRLESAGATLGFGASVHNTSFGGRALAEDLPMLLALLSECLRLPVFPENQVERLRGQMLAGLMIRAQDTADQASMAFDEVIFPNHPYGRPEDGFPETIKAITRQDLTEFHRLHFGPRSLVLVLVGGVDAQAAVEQVSAALGDWTNPDQTPVPDLPQIEPLHTTLRRHIPLAGKSQTDLVMGTLGPRRNSPDFLSASLGNNILGQFGMMGRIGDVVREQEGLAYHASTSLNSWIEGGSWEVSAGVNPTNLQRAIDLILSELGRFIREPVSIEELEDSQANFVGRLPLSLESNGGIAGSLLNIERFNLGLDYYRRYPELVKAVTPESILEVARIYLNPEKLAIVSSGPELSEPAEGVEIVNPEARSTGPRDAAAFPNAAASRDEASPRDEGLTER